MRREASIAVTRIDRKPEANATAWLPQAPEAPQAPGTAPSFGQVLANVTRPAAAPTPSVADHAAAGQKAAELVAAGADIETVLPLFFQGLPVKAPAVAATTASQAYGATGSAAQRLQQIKPLFTLAEQQTGVPWQIQAAQWALETGWGLYTPKDATTGQESYNLFGIKGVGPAGSVSARTTEVVDGQSVAVTDQFRAYNSAAESVLEHARLLTTGRYALPAGTSLQAWTENLQRQGYATDPQYAGKLWQIIEQNGWETEE